jgi:aminoglycoside phosphotransferase (APT) family kinase protein
MDDLRVINFPVCNQEIICQFSENREVTEFEEGLSNSTFLVEHEGKKYVVRDFHSKKTLSGCFRELWMMQLASELGIAPNIVHINLKKGYVVIDYIEGYHPDKSDDNSLKQAVLNLKKMHQQVRYEPFSSIYERVRSIEIQENSRLNEAIEWVRKIEELIKDTGCTFCHLDFHTKNIIQETDGDSWIIDWECTGLGHPFYDIAKLTHSRSWDDARKLLGMYLEKKPSLEEETQFYLMRAVVYMSIATNRFVKGDVENARIALDSFHNIIQSEAFKKYTQ